MKKLENMKSVIMQNESYESFLDGNVEEMRGNKDLLI